MAYTYTSWITYTGASRLSALRLHIKEVSDEMSARMSAGGTSYDPGPLTTYLQNLMDQESKLASAINGAPFFLPTRRRF